MDIYEQPKFCFLIANISTVVLASVFVKRVERVKREKAHSVLRAFGFSFQTAWQSSGLIQR
ncbi:unnamed protein product [Ceratitis capitata]|uniref:(Mediterranean fruit fly) hypothetical protein n=1 Tax=Ceratitis capitata TaxID=7213 RepID=A0A811UMI7_CERCA|nr:unnamed protein product [Ceratitis capitata]